MINDEILGVGYSKEHQNIIVGRVCPSFSIYKNQMKVQKGNGYIKIFTLVKDILIYIALHQNIICFISLLLFYKFNFNKKSTSLFKTIE